MSTVLTILSFLGVIILLVLAHELGHFFTAKLSGVKVLEFGIGFPPRLFAVKHGETEYSINLVLLGGFCKMLGEEDPGLPKSLASKSIGTRILVLSAGSLMNLLLPIVLFSASFMVPKEVLVEEIAVSEVVPNSPAAIAGIMANDIITEIDGYQIRNRGELLYYTQLTLGSETSFVVKRDSATFTLMLTPRWNPPPGEGAIGIGIMGTNPTIVSESYPVWQAFPKGAHTCLETFVLFKNEVTGWFVKRTLPPVTGPIGIAQMTGKVAEAGISPLLAFTAFISINLALVNVFPFPGLDGGRLVFVLVEFIRRGKRISPQRENLIHLVGFILLLSLMVLISYFDISHIISGESLIP